MQDFDWSHLRFVLAVFRAKSLAGAAKTLHVNETTVARRITQLEQHLGSRVFSRVNGLLEPTTSGILVVRSAERVERETLALEHAVSTADQHVRGTVRVTAVPIMLNHMLVPALPRFMRRYHELHLELVAESRSLSLINRQADIAIRLARPTQEQGALARRLGCFEYAAYFRIGEDEHALPWITFDDGMQSLPQAQWIAGYAKEHTQSISRVKVNDGDTVLRCVAAGLGKSLLPCVVGDGVPELMRSTCGVVLSREIWMMVDPDQRHLARTNVVVEWLTELLGSA